MHFSIDHFHIFGVLKSQITSIVVNGNYKKVLFLHSHLLQLQKKQNKKKTIHDCSISVTFQKRKKIITMVRREKDLCISIKVTMKSKLSSSFAAFISIYCIILFFLIYVPS